MKVLNAFFHLLMDPALEPGSRPHERIGFLLRQDPESWHSFPPIINSRMVVGGNDLGRQANQPLSPSLFLCSVPSSLAFPLPTQKGKGPKFRSGIQVLSEQQTMSLQFIPIHYNSKVILKPEFLSQLPTKNFSPKKPKAAGLTHKAVCEDVKKPFEHGKIVAMVVAVAIMAEGLKEDDKGRLEAGGRLSGAPRGMLSRTPS